MRNQNRFSGQRPKEDEKSPAEPTVQETFMKDIPRPHKPGVRLTGDQMKRFKRAVVDNEESIQDALERAVENYIATTEEQR